MHRLLWWKPVLAKHGKSRLPIHLCVFLGWLPAIAGWVSNPQQTTGKLNSDANVFGFSLLEGYGA